MNTLIICLISVAVNLINNNTYIIKTEAQGKLIKEFASDYIIDFSEYAKKQSWRGDYSKIVVSKKECVRL